MSSFDPNFNGFVLSLLLVCGRGYSPFLLFRFILMVSSNFSFSFMPNFEPQYFDPSTNKSVQVWKVKSIEKLHKKVLDPYNKQKKIEVSFFRWMCILCCFQIGYYFSY